MYNTIILLTCHESKECVIDCIENIFKFNKNICIVINPQNFIKLKWDCK